MRCVKFYRDKNSTSPLINSLNRRAAIVPMINWSSSRKPTVHQPRVIRRFVGCRSMFNRSPWLLTCRVQNPNIPRATRGGAGRDRGGGSAERGTPERGGAGRDGGGAEAGRGGATMASPVVFDFLSTEDNRLERLFVERKSYLTEPGNTVTS